MKIIPLVENTSKTELKAKHGLSLYIETEKHRILFDLGPDNTLFENADKRNIDLSKVDTAIISHGHMDHGGALKRFMEINSKARIYVQRSAFRPHFTKTLFIKVPVGLDAALRTNDQMVLIEGDHVIDDELSLFTVEKTGKCYSPMNDVLYEGDGKDPFVHEQNLIISENETVLIMGCGHAGIVNIMEKAKAFHPSTCIGGYHLFNPVTKRTVSDSLLDEIASELKKYENVSYYTCHCTGKKAFEHLSRQMNNLKYISCGEQIEI